MAGGGGGVVVVVVLMESMKMIGHSDKNRFLQMTNHGCQLEQIKQL